MRTVERINAGHPAVGAFVDRFYWVETYLKATPGTLPRQLEQLIVALRKEGWDVLVRSVGTDFQFSFVPIPKTQKVILGLARSTAGKQDAIAAIQKAGRQTNAQISLLREYAKELSEEVVQPTINDLKKSARDVTPLLIGGGVLLFLWRLK